MWSLCLGAPVFVGCWLVPWQGRECGAEPPAATQALQGTGEPDEHTLDDTTVYTIVIITY